MSEEQIASGAQPFVQIVDDPATGTRIEVDEHVAAEHGVYAPEGRGLDTVQQIQMSEVAGLPQPVDHVMSVFPLDEVCGLKLWGGRAKGAAPVHPSPRIGNVALRDVAADDPDVPVDEKAGLMDQCSQGIGLFAGGATGAPYGQPALVCVRLRDPRQELVSECTELVFLT